MHSHCGGFCWADSLHEATNLFEDVLSRREKADAARHALAVMTRYKFLFFLPLNIEHNIKHGDFDLVMSDYARARNLFGKFETPVIICGYFWTRNSQIRFNRIVSRFSNKYWTMLRIRLRIWKYRGTLNWKICPAPSNNRRKLSGNFTHKTYVVLSSVVSTNIVFFAVIC